MGPTALFAPELLKDQVWLVTGGGTGIGRATAELASSLGANVAITARNVERLADVAAGIEQAGGHCFHAGCDIREPEQIQQLVEGVKARFGRIDVLVNNAGGQFPMPAQQMSLKGFDAVIRNNLSGTFYITQAVANAALIPQGSGAIVNVIANIYRGFPGMAHTGAARAGVDNLTKTLAVEWAQFGLRVNAVAPGVIDSGALAKYGAAIVEMSKRQVPLKRHGTSEEVAAAIIFLGSPAASYITGATLYVDGGDRLWGDVWPIPDPPD